MPLSATFFAPCSAPCTDLPDAELSDSTHLALWCSALSRWAERTRWLDPGAAWSAERWLEWARQARLIGLVVGRPDTGEVPEAVGLWCAPLRQDRGLAMAALATLVEAWSRQGPAAGLGWALHRWALGHWVWTQSPVRLANDVTPIYIGPGQWGLCPEGLAPWWCGHALDEGQTAALIDWTTTPPAGLTVLLPAHWTHLVRAIWLADGLCGHWQWQVLARDELGPQALEPLLAPPLGLSPLQSWCIRAADTAWQPMTMPPAQADALWREVLVKDQLGAMAVSAGAWQSADRAVHDHVAWRHQGGRRLAEHPAVQQMRGRMAEAAQGAHLRMQAWQQAAADPAQAATLMSALLDRRAVHDQLLQLTDEGLQAMGAAGYLSDSPVAQAWRDQRTLRQMAGGVGDVHRVVAWCRQHEGWAG